MHRSSRLKAILVMLICVGVLSPAVHADSATVYLGSTSLSITFDKPKGSIEYYEVNETLNLVHSGNDSLTITGLAVSFQDVTGISASVARKSFSFSGAGSARVNVTFKINYNLSETTYNGKLSITGDNVNSKNESVSITVVHPPATISAVWEDEWGKVKAGTTFTKSLKINESMGYKSASNVSVKITHQGPAILAYSSDLGDFSPMENKTMPVNVTIPPTGIKPGTYPLKITISSPTNISIVIKNASYTLPTPQMVLSGTTLDLGRITFEPGKETSENTLVIQEIGGYTPIEGLKFSLASGEVGWISHTEKSYISPGGTERYTFKVSLPTDGTLGEKSWRYTLATNYAGSKEIVVKVLVYFPGIEEALSYLQTKGSLPEYPESEKVMTGTINLLEKTKGTVDTKKIVSVMSIYSGVRSFLNDIEDVSKNKEHGNLVAAGDSIIRAHRSLTKMKVGEENLDTDFSSVIKTGVDAADDIWTNSSKDVLEDLEREASKTRESNYKQAVIYYKRISQIYALRGDQKKADEFSALQKEMEAIYQEYITYANGNKTYADDEKEKALEKTFRIRDASYVVNPLAFDSVISGLENAISAYEEAERLYRLAGEIDEADLLRDTVSRLKEQHNGIKRSFTVFGLLLVILLVGFLIRASLALQHYRVDEEESKVGDIVMKGEEKIEE